MHYKLFIFSILCVATVVMVGPRFGNFVAGLFSFLAQIRMAFYCLSGIGLLVFGIVQLRETWRNDR